jgi:pimeloyl-ACP methyl ester carboxylesterase
MWSLVVAALGFAVPFRNGELAASVRRGTGNASSCVVFFPGGPGFPIVEILDELHPDWAAESYHFVTMDFCGTGQSTCDTAPTLLDLTDEASALLARLRVDECAGLPIVSVGYSAAAHTVLNVPAREQAECVALYMPLVHFHLQSSVRDQCLSVHMPFSVALPDFLKRGFGYLLCGLYCPDESDPYICGLKELLAGDIVTSRLLRGSIDAELFRTKVLQEYASTDLLAERYALNRTVTVTSKHDFIAASKYVHELHDRLDAPHKVLLRMDDEGHFSLLAAFPLFARTIDAIVAAC